MSLQREADAPSTGPSWARRNAASLACAGLGLVAIAVASLLCYGGDETVRIPDGRFTTPFLVATLAAGLVALIRREKAYPLLIAGVALAGAAMMLGWAIVVAIVAGITAVIILVMHELM